MNREGYGRERTCSYSRCYAGTEENHENTFMTACLRVQTRTRDLRNMLLCLRNLSSNRFISMTTEGARHVWWVPDTTAWRVLRFADGVTASSYGG